jgi:eukaryotic-like serine/threonine-protein kinase
MRLHAGARLGPYEILAPLGQGGMGEVYRARDTRLGRDVAIKIAAEAFSERFEREARAISALNHPNLCALYDVGPDYLVMELVDGHTLRGPMPIDEALSTARQIAVALEAAHEKGITHRDLKPANIKITTGGAVKVLDFGLAKTDAPSQENADNSPTFTAATHAGTILGTAAYMSPEQARGMAVDKRTDIWAFGVVLFELLTGKQLFAGDSVTDTLAAVVRAEPDFSALPASTPASIRRLLKRCLEKDRRKRLPDIGVARLEIDDAGVPDAPAVVPATRRSGVVPWLVAVIALMALAAVSWLSLRTPPEIPWTGGRLGGAEVALSPKVSPDGQLVAFLAMVDGLTQVAVMKPQTGNWTVLTRDRSRGTVNNLCWSRDSAKLYFDRMTDAPRGIFSVPVLGGDEQLVVEDAISPEVLPDGSLLMQRLNAERRYQVNRVWPESGRVQPLKILVPFTTGSLPFRATPSGDRMVFAGTPLDQPTALSQLYAMDFATERIVRLDAAIPARGDPLATTADSQSALVAVTTGDLYRLVRVPLDGTHSVRTILTLTSRVEYVDVGRDGAIYLDQWERPVEVVRVSLDGRPPEHIAAVTLPPGGTSSLPLMDGRVLVNSRIGGRNHVLMAAPGRELTPFVETQEETGRPMALVGNAMVAFMIGADSGRTIALASLTDRRITRRLEGSKGVDVESMVASPDGKAIYYAASGSIWTIPVDDGQPRRLQKGDSVTIDPYRQDLIIRLTEKEGTRLVRQPIAGGPEQPIALKSDAPLAPWYPLPNAVSSDGRILVPLASPASWFWRLGAIDPGTGRVQIIPFGYDADLAGAWTHDGRIIVSGVGLRSSLWRFVPDTAAAR